MQKIVCLFLILGFFPSFVFAQTQTPVYLSQAITNANSKGFYRYLPADYTTSSKNYPLIIWVHGAGQVGQGNTTELPKVLEWGVPKIISEGGFPASFTVGADNFSFIIISPQFMGWPSGGNIEGILSYVMNNYRVDPERVYLMGISAGGGGIWQYASTSVAYSNKLAAMIPFCGTLNGTQALAGRIAAANLPVWAFHNTNDGTVSVAYSRNWKNYINAYVPSPTNQAKLTEFPVVSNNAVTQHECWSLATLPSYKPNGINIYEWMLGYKKRTATTNALPVANAGQDQGIVIPASAVITGSGSSDPDGVIVSYSWKKISGPASHNFVDSTLANATVGNLAQGAYQFELTVTDNLGGVSKDIAILNVYANLPPGAQQRILIDIGNSASTGGTITNSPNLNGNVWNNMTDARPGVRVANAITINNQPSGISLEVINRLDGTFSTGSAGTGIGNNAVIVSDYPASATTDHALIHSSATNGIWRIKGMDPAQVYAVKFWGARTNTTASRIAEIKRSDDNVWKSYNAMGNTNYNNAAVFNITGQTQMDFNIRTKVGSDFSAINVLDISYGGSETTPINQPPVAWAGADIVVQLPTDSVLVQGCTSSDPEQAVLKYKWRKISGPASYQLPVDTLCSVKVKGLITGVYTFELVVIDTAGLTGKDTVAVTVNTVVPTPWPAQVTALCNSPYKIVVVGSSTAFGTGASPIDSSWVNKFRRYLQTQNQQVQVINIATLGLTSWDVSPTGTTVPAGYTIDTERNITKALSLNPDAIIFSLPSNDVARGIPTNDTRTNYLRITALATAANVPVWVTTTQPRNGLSPSERILQMEQRDWINSTYGNKAVDYWTTVANADGTIHNFYGSGDGVHLNNYGHHVLFTRIVGEKLWDSLCIRKNIPPVAMAGNDIIVAGTTVNIILNGSSSYDPDGGTLAYNWRIINNANAVLTNHSSSNPGFTTNISGSYFVELKVTDQIGHFDLDTVKIVVYTSNVPPLANAGTDILLIQLRDSIQLNGSASTDMDGLIANYKWQQISGAALSIVNDDVAKPWIKELIAGSFGFKLTVTDDSLAVDTDTVMLIVNASPLANAGADVTVTLPAAVATFTGSASTDSDGSIATYRWKKASGTGAVTITDSTAAQTNISFSIAGQYIVELAVTDNLGGVGRDSVLITVNPDPNLAPVANAGNNQTITFPVNTAILNGQASTDNDGNISSYKWKKISGANVVMADSTAAQTNVTFTNAGQYLFELTVTDNGGALGKDTVIITVNPDPNRMPVSNAGPDGIVQMPINIAFFDGRNSFDPDGSLLTYTWSYVSGPPQSIINTATKDTTSISFINAGVYVFSLTVTDPQGLTGTDQVTVNVLPGLEVNKKMKVNVFAGSNPFTNTEWNNWNVAGSLTSAKFNYTDGAASNINAVLSTSALIADNGANYMTNATASPYQVLRYASANTSVRSLEFIGLNPAKTYNFEFYASRNNTGNSSVYQIGNSIDTISTSSNANDVARFSNISPTVNGRIIVNISRIGTWNYLAGFTLTEQNGAAPPPIANLFLTAAGGVDLANPDFGLEACLIMKVHPNPAQNKVFVTVPGSIIGRYFIQLTDVNGKIVWSRSSHKSNDDFIETINITSMPKGIYFLQLSQLQQPLMKNTVIKL